MDLYAINTARKLKAILHGAVLSLIDPQTRETRVLWEGQEKPQGN